ncbi:hypothetical protein CP02DC21_1110, partial [Chlamydia psittaci 02DC21]
VTFCPSFKKFISHCTLAVGISICSKVSESIKTILSPALYKKSIVTLSIMAFSTFSPPVKVLTVIAPVLKSFDLIFTFACPLPCLECENSKHT